MPPSKETVLDADSVLDAFQNAKDRTDESIRKNNMSTYCADFLPRADELAIAIFCNAFENLGCKIRSAGPSTRLERPTYMPQHQKLIDHILEILEKDAGLIEKSVGGGRELTRTSQPCPSVDITSLVEGLLRDRPAQDAEVKLMQITGTNFAECLSGKIDAIQLLFGASDGRVLLDRLYATSDASGTVLQQLEVFIEDIAATWPTGSGPLRILEIGAGTGGTTSRLLPALARLDVPVVYTFTDLSPTLVTEAASKYEKYPFMEFEVVDIEKEPSAVLKNSQHIVLGSNVIHATRKLSESLAMVHRLLRPDGFLVFHELTTRMLWADVVFGLFEGWWRFDDGRRHALQSPKRWADLLTSAGFGHVDYTDGRRPEAALQKLIFAMASNPGPAHLATFLAVLSVMAIIYFSHW
ncbi:methyltransferase domain-containing protein [Astrocystis sublimbata]|nr:methyltransferase domain-containing protein [Astrocystis sublimbata]